MRIRINFWYCLWTTWIAIIMLGAGWLLTMSTEMAEAPTPHQQAIEYVERTRTDSSRPSWGQAAYPQIITVTPEDL